MYRRSYFFSFFARLVGKVSPCPVGQEAGSRGRSDFLVFFARLVGKVSPCPVGQEAGSRGRSDFFSFFARLVGTNSSSRLLRTESGVGIGEKVPTFLTILPV